MNVALQPGKAINYIKLEGYEPVAHTIDPKVHPGGGTTLEQRIALTALPAPPDAGVKPVNAGQKAATPAKEKTPLKAAKVVTRVIEKADGKPKKGVKAAGAKKKSAKAGTAVKKKAKPRKKKAPVKRRRAPKKRKSSMIWGTTLSTERAHPPLLQIDPQALSSLKYLSSSGFWRKHQFCVYACADRAILGTFSGKSSGSFK